jgi:predicted molibdopterin-dependent oxidoreductase YjgC
MDIKNLEPPLSLFSSDEVQSDSSVRINFEGHTMTVPSSITVAAALLLSGVRTFRTTPISDMPRAAYCLMGVCFECLVEIDGKPSRQSCLTPVREGMVIRRQHGASAVNQAAEGE